MAILGGDGLADNGVRVHHLVNFLHRNVHQALNRMLCHKTTLLYSSVQAAGRRKAF